jgi:hypothetical protein
MKLVISLALFCSIIFASCKKGDNANANLPANIEGTWDYIGFSGGLAGFPFTSANAEGPYIQIQGSLLLVTYGIQGQQKCMGYQFKQDSIVSGGYEVSGVLTTRDTSFMLPMPDLKDYRATLSHDTLTLYPLQCADCFTTVYIPTSKHFTCTGD